MGWLVLVSNLEPPNISRIRVLHLVPARARAQDAVLLFIGENYCHTLYSIYLYASAK
jgi:hypothetical protein